MSRIILSCCFVLTFLFAPVLTAQQANNGSSEPYPATPAVLRMIEKCEESLKELEKPEDKALILFQMLSLETRLTDKEPARRTIGTLLELVSTMEREGTRMQILEAVAQAQAELGDYESGIKTASQIGQNATRAEGLLNLAEKIIGDNEEKKAEKPFDVTGLLRQAAAGAAEAKDPGLEALVSAILGRELAKQGKIEDARNAFDASRNKAREIEQVEERNTIALIVRGQVQNGMIDDALKLIENVPSEEYKEAFTALASIALAQVGKTAESMEMLAKLQAGDAKDNALIGIGREYAEKESAEKLLELAALTSSPERKEMFLGNVLPILMEKKRFDIAAELGKQSASATELETVLKMQPLETLIEEKKFDEAQKFIDTLEDESIRQNALRHLVLARIKETGGNDALTLAEATQSEEEKKAISTLEPEMTRAAEIKDPDDRMTAYFEILETQFQLFDLRGVSKTIEKMLQTVSENPDPAKKLVGRIVVSRIQMELNDTKGAKENIGQLVKALDETKDLNTLQGLVPEDRNPMPLQDDAQDTSPILTLKVPVSEDAIRDQVFQIYLTASDALAQMEEWTEANKTLQKSARLAEAETDPAKKAQKLLLLAQVQAEFDRAKEKAATKAE